MRTPNVDTAADRPPQDQRAVPSRHITIDNAELSGDDGGLFCRACGGFTPFCFANPDGNGGFQLDCRNCCKRLLSYRAPRRGDTVLTTLDDEIEP